jgi:hypothetical protein
MIFGKSGIGIAELYSQHASKKSKGGIRIPYHPASRPNMNRAMAQGLQRLYMTKGV